MPTMSSLACTPTQVTARSRSVSPTSPLVSPRNVELSPRDKSFSLENDDRVVFATKKGASGQRISYVIHREDKTWISVENIERGTDFDAFRDFIDNRVVKIWSGFRINEIVLTIDFDEYNTIDQLWRVYNMPLSWYIMDTLTDKRRNPIFVCIVCTLVAFADIVNALMFSDLLRIEWKKNETDEYTRVLKPETQYVSV